MNKLKLAIIGSGRMAWIIGKNAHEMDLETHCFSNVESAFIHETIDFFHNISIFKKETILSICMQEGITGVIATTELTIAIAAYVAKELGIQCMPYDIAMVITNKYRNRLKCRDLQILHQPKFAEIKTEDELLNCSIAFPIILKPIATGGKQGITVVKNQNELQEAYRYAKERSGTNPVIVEEYLEGGNEYSVESLSCKGKHYIVQVTEKITSGPPHCVELGHRQPANLSKHSRNLVEQAVIEGLKAVGIDNTSCHTEIKIINNKVYLIEFNARPGGDHIAWPLTTLSTGYEYIKGAISIAMGQFEGVDKAKFKSNYSGVYFITKQTEFLKPLFDICEKYPWLYHKNEVAKELQVLEHNDCYNTNSIMYFSKEQCPNIEEILRSL